MDILFYRDFMIEVDISGEIGDAETAFPKNFNDFVPMNLVTRF